MSIPSTMDSVVNFDWSGVSTLGGFSCDIQEIIQNMPINDGAKKFFVI